MAGKKKQARNRAVTGQGTLGNVTDYRHDEATRKNNPPAKIAAEGTVPIMPKIRYEYSPRLAPALRFDSTGQADKLPELLQKAQRQPLTAAEATQLADALRNQEPWLRLSAAYKGVNALLMKEGAQDFRSGQKFDHTVFFGENVDIHHIFPQDWCKKQGIKPGVFDSIINKTPLSYRTNRVIGGVAPSEYIERLEKGNNTTPPLDSTKLNSHLISHLIAPSLLRADDFDAFMEDRQKRLLGLIEEATGKSVYSGNVQEEGVDVEADDDAVEAELTLA